jgi:DNA-directed RNA polymerase subunit beta'
MIGAEAIYEILARDGSEKIAGELRTELASTTSELKPRSS